MDDSRTGSYGLLIQACRDEYLSQETQNREFSLKAIGIVAFSITVFGVVITFVNPEKIDSVSVFFLSFISICLLVSIVFAILVVKPKHWVRPFDIKHVLERTDEDGSALAAAMAKAYANAIDKNWRILDPKADYLIYLTYCAAAQVILSAVFIFYLFSV